LLSVSLIYECFACSWEYPNNQGLGCNTIDDNDTANFLDFTNELRETLPSEFILTAATAITPFMDATGNPSTDVAAFADVLTYVAIMNYDLWVCVFVCFCFATLISLIHSLGFMECNSWAKCPRG
jgi:hypothetical protein